MSQPTYNNKLNGSLFAHPSKSFYEGYKIHLHFARNRRKIDIEMCILIIKLRNRIPIRYESP